MVGDDAGIGIDATLHDGVSEALAQMGETIADFTRGVGTEVGAVPAEAMAGLGEIEASGAQFQAQMESLASLAERLDIGALAAEEEAMYPAFMERVGEIPVEAITSYGIGARDPQTGRYIGGPGVAGAQEAQQQVLADITAETTARGQAEVAELAHIWQLQPRPADDPMFAVLGRAQQAFAQMTEQAGVTGWPDIVDIGGIQGRLPGAEAAEFVGGRVEALQRFAGGEEAFGARAKQELRETLMYLEHLQDSMGDLETTAVGGTQEWAAALQQLIPGLHLTHIGLAAVVGMVVVAGRYGADAFSAWLEPIRQVNGALEDLTQHTIQIAQGAIPEGGGQFLGGLGQAAAGTLFALTGAGLDVFETAGRMAGGVFMVGLTTAFAAGGMAIAGPLGAAIGAGIGVGVGFIGEAIADAIGGTLGTLVGLGVEIGNALLQGIGQALQGLRDLMANAAQEAAETRALARWMGAPEDWARGWQGFGAMMGDPGFAETAFGDMGGLLEYSRHRFAAMGVDIEQAPGVPREVPDILADLREQYEGIVHPLERVVTLQYLFGQAAEPMRAFLDLPTEQFERALAMTEEYQLWVSELGTDAAEMELVGMEMRHLSQGMELIAYSLASALLPVWETGLGLLRQIVSENLGLIHDLFMELGRYLYVDFPEEVIGGIAILEEASEGIADFFGRMDRGLERTVGYWERFRESMEGVADVIFLGHPPSERPEVPEAPESPVDDVGWADRLREIAGTREDRAEFEAGLRGAGAEAGGDREIRLRIDCPYEAACPFRRDFTGSVARAVVHDVFGSVVGAH